MNEEETPLSPYSSFTGFNDECAAVLEPPQNRRFDAHVSGNSAAELEEAILAKAREAFGENVELEVMKTYLISKNFGQDQAVKKFQSGMTVRVMEPKRDERTVAVSAEGNNVTELEQDALAKANGFFVTHDGDRFVVDIELEIVPDYQVSRRSSSPIIEGVLHPKDWSAEVLVRVARSPKPVTRDLTKPVFVDGDFKVFETDYGTFVSADQGGWLPGAYSSPRVAEDAYRALDINKLETLWERANLEDRAINAEDLLKAAESKEGE